jgi:tetratricopeptide (TPR) repeat protein
LRALRSKRVLCILVLVFSIQLSIPVLAQDSRGNLTGMPQEELLDMHDLLLEQRWGSGDGIDLAAFMQIYGLSGNGLHSPGEYLNDSELNDVITSSDYLFQQQGDLINQSNSLFDQGKYNESLQVYNALLGLNPIIDITRLCRCSAACILAEQPGRTISSGDDFYPSGEPKQPLAYESVMEKRQSQEELGIKCMECEYEVDNAKYSEDPRITSLTRNMQTAKAALDEELAINESDPVYWYNLGERLLNLDELNRSDRMNESIAAFNKAIELNTTYVEAWDRKGFVLSFLDCAEAIKAFDKALEIDPNYVYSWSNKAFCLRDQGVES